MAGVQQTFLRVGVTLGTGSFGAAGSNKVTLDGYRMTADIAKNGIPAMNTAQLRIYGLNPSLMNQLTRVGLVPTALRDNVVSVEAGTDPDNLSLAFVGVLMDAWADYDAVPDVAFNISALTGYLANIKPVLPSSYPGTTSVAEIMQQLATQMGYTLENNGVDTTLSSPYLPGTARAQAIAAAAAADIFLVFEDDQGIMAIFPKNASRNVITPIIQPPPNGKMIGYPSYVGPGMIKVRTQYDPSIRFGGNINIQGSSIQPANGPWRVVQLTHNLSTQMPKGDWKTEVIGNLQLASTL